MEIQETLQLTAEQAVLQLLLTLAVTLEQAEMEEQAEVTATPQLTEETPAMLVTAAVAQEVTAAAELAEVTIVIPILTAIVAHLAQVMDQVS